MSREQILQKIRSNRPQQSNLPGIDIMQVAGEPIQKFTAMAKSAGSGVEKTSSLEELTGILEQHMSAGARIFNLTRGTDPPMIHALREHVFSDADVVVLSAALGIAENGAVWIPEDMLILRRIPFVAGHLIVVLDMKNIVADMHEAYARIDLSATGFGVFIAGPSKTADIEQSLVIGAHGPVKSTVILY